MIRFFRVLACLGFLCAGTVVCWLVWHTWPLTAVAPLAWRLNVLVQNIGLYIGLLGSFALAAVGSPRARRVGWALVVVLVVGTMLWTMHGLGDLLTASILPFSVPEPSESHTNDAAAEDEKSANTSNTSHLTEAEREQVVASLYNKYADMLCLFADRVLQHRGRHLRAVTAADVVHDAFALLLAGERDGILIQGDEATRRYLVGVIKLSVGDQSRTARRRSTLDRQRHETAGTPMTDAPDTVYTTAELELRIQEVLALAPASEVAAYQAVRVEGLAYAEAAKTLGVSPEMIGVLLSRLAARFRWALRDWPVPPPKRGGRRQSKDRPDGSEGSSNG